MYSKRENKILKNRCKSHFGMQLRPWNSLAGSIYLLKDIGRKRDLPSLYQSFVKIKIDQETPNSENYRSWEWTAVA
jgi:hypothetical protein